MRTKIANLFRTLYHRAFASYRTWCEWEEAKCWAREVHPGWVYIATRAKTEETRKKYRDKIMLAYLGECDDATL